MRLKWPGFSDDGTVLIELSPETFCLAKHAVDIGGEYFVAKEELHITLVGSKLGSMILNKIKSDRTINNLLKNTFEEINWSYQATDIVHILSRLKDGLIEKSIILPLDMPGLAGFYDQLKLHGIIDTVTPIPPAHVTLYTHNCPLGIGVSSYEDLKTLCSKTLALSELDKRCRAGGSDG